MFTRVIRSSRLPLRLFVALVVAGGFGLSAAPSAHAAPVNDEPAGAIDVPGVPFSDTSDISGATSNVQGDSLCGRGGTVWYAFTPETDGNYRFDTLASDFDTTLALWTSNDDPEHSRSLLDCTDDDGGGGVQSVLLSQLTAGTTYLIEAGQKNFYEPNTSLVLNIDFAPTFDMQVAFNPQGKIGVEPGTATVSFAITCNNRGEVYSAFITVHQRQGKKVVSATVDFGVLCGPTTKSVQLLVSGGSQAFVPGTATLSATFSGCDQFSCDGASVNRTLKLRR